MNFGFWIIQSWESIEMRIVWEVAVTNRICLKSEQPRNFFYSLSLSLNWYKIQIMCILRQNKIEITHVI